MIVRVMAQNALKAAQRNLVMRPRELPGLPRTNLTCNILRYLLKGQAGRCGANGPANFTLKKSEMLTLPPSTSKSRKSLRPVLRTVPQCRMRTLPGREGPPWPRKKKRTKPKMVQENQTPPDCQTSTILLRAPIHPCALTKPPAAVFNMPYAFLFSENSAKDCRKD